MNVQPKRRAGQPIVVFFALLLGWVGMRVTVWESPFPLFVPTNLVESKLDDRPGKDKFDVAGKSLPSFEETRGWSFESNSLIAPPQPVTVDLYPPVPIPGASVHEDRSEILASHQLLWLAAMGQVPIPRDIAQMMRDVSIRPNSGSPSTTVGVAKSTKRWSIDGWLYLRPDATLAANTGPRFASYGASQAGSVMRYRLSSSSPARPAAYLRATKALAAGRESEVAAGLSARIIPAIPVAVYAELRATRGAVTTEFRPAGFVVTEIPTLDLPLRLRAETYFSAGYVGGDFATPFADGQARIDREIARFDRGSIRAGAGAWGGAQKGAARLDVGPSASIDVKLGEVPARLSLDYRLRVAGDAEPGSGVAITLSTGF